jgi:hypothetical protein
MNNPIRRRNYYMCSTTVLCSLITFVGLTSAEAQAQVDLPVLNATSPNVKILDSNSPDKGDWIVDPSIEIDTYYALRSDKKKTITFQTDIDSKAFEVEPGHVYDFVILLNGKDSCKTRISTMVQGFQRIDKGDKAEPLVIPITIQRGKLFIRGSVNGSKMLDLIFDTGADTCVIYPSAKSKGVELKFDGTVLNAGSGGVTVRQVSHDNRLEISHARWNHEPFLYIERQAERADGIIGYTVFENHIVEIDYDRMLMIVHHSLPSHSDSFSKTGMPFFGSLPSVEVVMTNGDASFRGPFILDTAGTSCMLVNQAFAANHDMHSTLKKLGTSESRGVGSESIYSNQLMLPTLTIAGHSLNEVPINVELPSDWNKAPPGGVVCMDVLCRFNTILDFPANEAYFKPNSRFEEAFRIRGSGPSLLFVASLAGIILLASACTWYLARKRKHAQTPFGS